ncbi:hypothetical protein C1645_876138, partial [Glomus cerebriforme]
MSLNNNILNDDEIFLKEFLKCYNINDISKHDEIFLKEFLKGFYRQVIKIENFNRFENILMEWVKEFFEINKKDSKQILELMENHEEKENWFPSLIGFFYQHGIDNSCVIDKYESLKLYSLSINNQKSEKLVSVYQILDIIIGKYLLSFYYYKDIILSKRDLIEKKFKHVMSQKQFEDFNGLEINICKDEINTIEKYFELLDKGHIDKNKNKTDFVKMRELNNLGYSYQYGLGKEKDENKAFEFYLKSSEGGNASAQNNLGNCYQNGIGTKKDEKKAFECYLKAANEGDLYAQYNLGMCYQNGIGINKDDKRAFEWYYKSATEEYSSAQNKLGDCYKNGIGTSKDGNQAFIWYSKAAKGGNSDAETNLGDCYMSGIGVKNDLAKAFYWYEKAVKNGNITAQFCLGNYYMDTNNYDYDNNKAIYWY